MTQWGAREGISVPKTRLPCQERPRHLLSSPPLVSGERRGELDYQALFHPQEGRIPGREQGQAGRKAAVGRQIPFLQEGRIC